MLGINRVDLLVTHLGAEEQMTACDHGFLVGQRQLRSRLQCSDGRLKANGSRDAVEHGIGSAPGKCDNRLTPGVNGRIRGTSLF